MALNSTTREQLLNVSTATLCTALFKRGLRNQFIQDVRPLNGNLPNMVGEAFTLRYIPAREDLNTISVFQDRNHPQRVAVEQCPPGAVMVFDSWGGVLADGPFQEFSLQYTQQVLSELKTSHLGQRVPSIVFACDTALFSDMQLLAAGGIDLAVLPIGDFFTMGPEIGRAHV